MSLFTGKGDKGDTGLFGCNQRISKSSAIAEALGNLDEINSFLGFCKVRAKDKNLIVASLNKNVSDLVHEIQHNLFIIQAELAGSEMTITEDKVKSLEEVINKIETEMPPIKSFFVSGGTELAATFDFARTVARRAERRVVQVVEQGERKVGDHSRAFLNRLSSALYAFARYANFKVGVTEEPPSYK